MSKTGFKEKYGPWALITGGAMGLGAEFARQCAERGLNCVIVDKAGDVLENTAADIREKFQVSVEALHIDISKKDFLNEIIKKTSKLDIGMLVNNAGLTPVGAFLSFDSEFLENQLDVNVRAPLLLSRYFIPVLQKRKSGGMIFVSSGSANAGVPYSANYAGTKAWNLIFAESLWYELKKSGIDVIALMPGPTESPGWYANLPEPDSPLKPMSVEKTIRETLDSIGKKPSLSAGITNKIGTAFMRLAPRALGIKIVAFTMEKTFKKKTGIK
jgi:short-subunit dehydrogenase